MPPSRRKHSGSICPSVTLHNSFLSQKSASPQRQEQARLDVENAEDDLVQKTEVAITLMKTVLDNVSSLAKALFSSN